MNVGQLKAILATLPDDAPVLVSNGDHGYEELNGIGDKTALKKAITYKNPARAGRVYWTEDVLTGPMGEVTEYGQRVPAACLV